MKNPLLSRRVPSSAQGYSAFATDNFANFTSLCGYLLPVYWDYLEPGDKVSIKTLLRTRTQPLAKPAMATVIERIEWFAVPIHQLYKPFGTKYYGVNDVETDLLPTAGYDDYLPYVNLDDVDTYLQSLPTSLSTQAVIPTIIPTFGEARRLCDALGLFKQLGVPDTNTSFTTGVCVLPFAAYHKIYFDHYRLTDREENDPSYYNFDSYYGGIGATSQVSNTNNRFDKLFTLHKRPYMRDYFTSMQVSPMFGSADVNAAGNDLTAIQSWLNGLTSLSTGIPNTSGFSGSGALAPSNVAPTGVRLSPTNGSNATVSVVSSMFNTANIRSLFAVEKLLEVTRRAKKHYDMQTLAHFGVKVPKGIAGECYKLGTHEQYLKIGDVVGTANVVDSQDDPVSAIGQLGGTGSSGGESKTIKFESDCHCILMAIYSAEPVVNVQNEGTPRIFTITRASEFYKSEFDNLGLQPVFRRELFTQKTTQSTTENNTVIGWNWRYYQNKMKYNRSFGGCTTSSFREWSLNRQSIGAGSALSRNFFYVWPTDLNDILMVKYLGVESSSNLYFQDYFINQIYFDVVKSSKKSLYGDIKY